MDRAAAEREAIRLWRNLPVQDRLSPNQAIAFAAMIAPTLDFGEPYNRARVIEAWLLKDLPRTDPAAAISIAESSVGPGRLRLQVPPWPQREGASAIAFVISLLILIARRPDILTNAMFWAEDGAVWFANAYNEGLWAPLLRPHAGYLQTFPRLVWDFATLLPVRFAPLFGVWVALLVRAAIPAFIFSSRFTSIDWRAKVAITAYFLLMPNLGEVHANITNTHLYLGLYLLGVIVADPPRTLGWKIHDWVALLLAGTTGPLIIFVIPCLALRYYAQRNLPSVRLPFVAAGIALAVVQLVCIGLAARNLSESPLQADPMQLLEVLGARVFLGFITPARWASPLATPLVSVPAFIVGVGILVAVFVRGDWKAKGVILVPPLIVAAGILTPVFSLSQPQWPAFFSGNPAERYFVITSAAWAATLIYFAAIYLPRLSNAMLAVMVAIAGIFILFDFPLQPVPGTSFGPQANRIEAARSGQKITVPIAPPGWDMTLTKH
jgi:hypothetical protein